ncbi:SCO3374 family protein [Streptomyces sp. NPDC093094]|uniref:SCO3374 family protein n=1 Tax=Streptomyces sp. NPDC093094 TaxID=3366026 RepID=UPI003827A1AE
MVGAVPPVTPASPASPVPPSVPEALSSAPPALSSACPVVPSPLRAHGRGARVRRWYENELGWATVPGDPVLLSAGVRFDVLDVPVQAGLAALRHLRPGSPVAVCGERMWLLVAAGGAEELPGLLDWLEWGPLVPDLVPIGRGGHITAPPPVGHGTAAGAVSRTSAAAPGTPAGPDTGERPRAGAGSPATAGRGPGGSRRTRPSARTGSLQGAAWLRPPVPGCEVEASLPTLSALGGVGDAPDLARVVETVAAQCHRIRLGRVRAQPLAFSYASRMDAGTRPRSLTS